MSTVFRTSFPVPRSLALEGAGLEIGTSSIKFIELVRHPKGDRIVSSWGEEPLDGAIQGGEIVNKAKLLDALRRVKQRSGYSFVHVSLPEPRGFLFELPLPRAALLDMRGAVSLALPGQVPLAAEDAIFDCEIIIPECDEHTVNAVVTVFPKELASQYAEALSLAGLIPLSMELEPQASARAVVPRAGTSRGSTLILDVGETKSLICVVCRGTVRLTTSFEGIAALDQALRARDPQADIIRTKQEEGVSSADPELSRLFSKHLLSVCEEVRRYATYWNSRVASGCTRGEPVDSIILYGGNAAVAGFSEFLSRAINVPASVADVWTNVTPMKSGVLVPPIVRNESLRFATAIGLAMRSRAPYIW